MLVPRSTDPTDRLILALGAIALLIVVAWETVMYAMELLRINVLGDAFILASVVIPSVGPTALLLLVGWGIQRHRGKPPALFAGFVVLFLGGWATALAGNLWILFGFRGGGGPPITSVLVLFAIAGTAHLVGLFLLLLLAVHQRPSAPVLQATSPSPVDPIL